MIYSHPMIANNELKSMSMLRLMMIPFDGGGGSSGDGGGGGVTRKQPC